MHPRWSIPVLFALVALLPAAGEAQQSIVVTPKEEMEVFARPLDPRNAFVFRVTNNGATDALVNLTCAGAGAVSNCRVEDEQVTVHAGRYLRVVVRYASAASGAGTLQLTATGPDASDAAVIDVVVKEPVVESGGGMWLEAPFGVPTSGPSAGPVESAFHLSGTTGQPRAVYVSIYPYGGVFSGPIDIVVDWCASWVLLEYTMEMTLGKQDVTGNFDFQPVSPECNYNAQSHGTVSLTSSFAAFTAYICDKFDCASESVTYQKPVSDRPTVSTAMNPGNLLERSACVTTDAGPSGAFQCGELLLTHSMPSYRSKNRDRSLTMIYNSATASPKPIVLAEITVAAGVTVPDSMVATLTVAGVQRGQWRVSNQGFTFAVPTRRISLPFNAASMATGVYPYTVEIVSHSSQWPSPRASSSTGDLVIVNRSGSPYGAGWSIAGVEQVYPQTGGRMLLVHGDGSYAVYDAVQGTANKWLAPAGAYRDSIIQTGSSYVRHLLDGTRIRYNDVGRHEWTIDKVDSVQYVYRSATSTRAGLSQVRIAPRVANLNYTFAYSGANVETELLQEVTDPAGRGMALTMSGSRLVSARDPLAADNPGYTGTPAFPATSAGIVQFGYDAQQLLTTWTSRSGHQTRYAYRAGTALLDTASAPESVRWRYTAAQTVGLATAGMNITANPTQVLTSIQAPVSALPGTFQYKLNRFGAPVEITDPRGTRTWLSYSSTAPLLLARAEFANGRVVGMYYDQHARLIQADDSTHSAGLSSTRLEYGQPNAPDLPSKVVTPRDGTLRDSVRYTYNNMGLTQTITDSRGNVTSIAYNSTAGSPSRGLVQSITDAAGVTTFGYDATRGNLQSVNVPSTLVSGGLTTTYGTDAAGRVRKVTPPGSLASQFISVDVMNHVRALKVSDSITVKSGNQYLTVWRDTIITRFYTDLDGNDTLRIDPKGSRRSWTRDALGRVEVAKDEFGAADQHYYYGGAYGGVIRRNGTSVQHWRDAFGRDSVILFSVQGPGNYAADEIRYTYDAMGNPAVIDNSAATIRRQYTKEGLISRDVLFDKQHSDSAVFTYTYSKSGARRTMGTAQGTSVVYEYGADNLLSELKYTRQSEPQQTIRIFHDALGRRDSIDFPNSLAVGYGYDATGTLTSLKWSGSLRYAVDDMDAAGRVTSAELWNSAGSSLYSYSYDNRNQLVSEPGTRFGYDEAGNRLIMRRSNDTTKYTYATAGGMRTDRLIRAERKHGSSTTFRAYQFDAAGWMIQDSSSAGIWPHVYTAGGKLRTHNNVNPTTDQYRYDGLGRMITRRVGSNTVRIQYDGSNVASHGGLEFLHGPGTDDPLMALAQSDCMYVTAGGRAFDIIPDDGSGTCASSGAQYAGAILNSFSFELMRAEESSPSGAALLQYFRNRWYDAATGRFTQEDPIGFAGGSNLYAYSGNNPASYTDPFGLCPMCVVGAAWALYEIGSGIYDAVNAARTVASPTATTRQKIGTVALAAVSIVAPGGGYTTIGDNLHHVRKVSSGRLGGFLRGDTELSGGLNAAQSTFKSLTGRGPTGEFDRVILQDGREVLFRGSSRSGPPKIELVDPNKKFLEKITFKQ